MIIFESLLTTFGACFIFEAAGVVAKMARAYNQTVISKFNQVKHIQICETLCKFLA